MTAAHFAFIIVGLSLFSMVVNLLQQQLDEFVRYVKKRLFEMYKEALMADRNFTETNVKVLIKKMKGGRFLFPFLSKHIKEELQDELDLYVGRRTKSTQTEKLMIDQCFQTMGSLRPSVFQLTQTVKTFSPAANWM